LLAIVDPTSALWFTVGQGIMGYVFIQCTEKNGYKEHRMHLNVCSGNYCCLNIRSNAFYVLYIHSLWPILPAFIFFLSEYFECM